MFERQVSGCIQLGSIALRNGLKYKSVVVNAAGSREENGNTILYVDISSTDAVIANELLDILEKEGNFTCDLISNQIIN